MTTPDFSPSRLELSANRRPRQLAESPVCSVLFTWRIMAFITIYFVYNPPDSTPSNADNLSRQGFPISGAAKPLSYEYDDAEALLQAPPLSYEYDDAEALLQAPVLIVLRTVICAHV